MKIIGNSDNINEITFIHNGRNVKFLCFIKPLPYESRLDLEKLKRAEIVFNDLMEVDSVIEMLKRFRKECGEYIGEWKWHH
ncbi:MAG: hypothetical protein Q4D26_10470 [Clostridia bacterium]|nr:hypothetical protein [Clostridia bacterium]